MPHQEVIFIGLPGPTHNYGGLAHGNVASSQHGGNASHPREAAMQALELAAFLKSKGLEVAILPPQLRPDVEFLQATGFEGSAEEVIRRAAKDAPALLSSVYSSAAMWTANAATITPSPDSEDGKLHASPANLITNLHRSIEGKDTHRVLSHILRGKEMEVHAPLPAQADFADEGAANHMRFAPAHGEKGLNVFVYGREGGKAQPGEPVKYPARQTRKAFEAIARRHHISPAQQLHVQQHAGVIDEGVFHNDVIAVSNQNVLLYHEKAFAGGEADVARMEEAYQQLHPGQELVKIRIADKDLSVNEAVKTYFFNSQIVTRPDGGMTLIAPQESQRSDRARTLMEAIVADPANPIDEVKFLDLTQSMQNGGGPACLRLRVALSPQQLEQVKQNADLFLDEEGKQLARLRHWVNQHYRETIQPQDLADPALYREAEAALADLAAMTQVPVLPGAVSKLGRS